MNICVVSSFEGNIEEYKSLLAEFEEEMKAYRVQGFTCTNCAAIFENNVKSVEMSFVQ